MQLNRNSAGQWVIVLITLGFAACKSGSSDPKEHLIYYKDGGPVLRRYNTVNDKIEGKMQEFFPDGKIKVERNFVNGVEVGRVVVYYPDGKLKEAQYFDNGVQQGADTFWYADGKIQRITNFRDGKKDGALRTWNPDGSLLFEAQYKMDSLLEMKKATAIPPENGR